MNINSDSSLSSSASADAEPVEKAVVLIELVTRKPYNARTGASGKTDPTSA